mmetsp:Transcript_46722/g.111229  ORF Transcript_46722/g.111229 Transcript_46722/m.111229 type:complete len:626 (-) Transcript_46722:791-2668(-)
MGLLDLVTEDDRVGPPPHRLRQLPPLVVPDVPGRRPDQPVHRVGFEELRHIDANHHLLVVEQLPRQRPGGLGLPDARRAEEQEAPGRPVGVAEASARAEDSIRDARHGLVLPDNHALETVDEREDLVLLCLVQPRYRDARGARDHLRDLLWANRLDEEVYLLPVALRLHDAERLLEARDRVVLEFHNLIEDALLIEALAALVRGRLEHHDLLLRLFDLFLDLGHAADALLLLRELRSQRHVLFPRLGYSSLHLLQLDLALVVLLLGEHHALDLQPLQLARQVVDDLRGGIELDADVGARLVHEINGLVGQEPSVDVPVRQFRRREEGRVVDPHPVVLLVLGLDATQHRDRVQHCRLPYVHLLEAALEGGVLLDVLAVLPERRRPDAPQLAAGEHRLQEVSRVHAAIRRTSRAKHQVDLVDEEDDLPLRLRHLLEDALKPLLKLSLVLGSGNQRSHVEVEDAAAAEHGRHVPRDDALREALDNRGLAGARLADEDGVVLGAAREHAHAPADLLVAPDHRVEPSVHGFLDKIDSVLQEQLLVQLLCPVAVLVEDVAARADRLHRVLHRNGGRAGALEGVGDYLVLADPHQELVGRDELLVRCLRLLEGGVECAAEGGGGLHLAVWRE